MDRGGLRMVFAVGGVKVCVWATFSKTNNTAGYRHMLGQRGLDLDVACTSAVFCARLASPRSGLSMPVCAKHLLAPLTHALTKSIRRGLTDLEPCVLGGFLPGKSLLGPMVLHECLCSAKLLKMLRGGFKWNCNTLTDRHWTNFFFHPLALQSGDWDTLDKACKAFTLLPQLFK